MKHHSDGIASSANIRTESGEAVFTVTDGRSPAVHPRRLRDLRECLFSDECRSAVAVSGRIWCSVPYHGRPPCSTSTFHRSWSRNGLGSGNRAAAAMLPTPDVLRCTFFRCFRTHPGSCTWATCGSTPLPTPSRVFARCKGTTFCVRWVGTHSVYRPRTPRSRGVCAHTTGRFRI